MRLAPGTRLGPYEIVAPIGAGGMGEVYRARDTRLEREVAIKLVAEHLVTSPQAQARFEREARAVAALSHPNIVALHDVGRERSFAFAVMELLDGEALDRRLAKGPLPWRTAVGIAAAVADGLGSAHARGIIHRDLKPANIFLTRDGVVKIVDFGLAKGEATEPTTSTAQTMSGDAFGTPAYMSPEQVRGGTADARSDVFALGCVLYEMLAGCRPFRGNTSAETAAAILRDPPQDLAETPTHPVPASLGTLVRRCLAKEPHDRFQSSSDLAFGLRELLTDPAANAPGRAAAGARTFRWLSGLAAVAAIAATAWLVIAPLQRAGSPAAGSEPRTASPLLPAAYSAYERGRHAWEKRGESDLQEAIRHFQDAIDAEPTYAPAYAAMADAYAQLGYGSYVAPDDAFPRARAAAEKAIELNPVLAEGHASRGYALMYYDWNFPEAEKEYRTAINLNPRYAVAHQWYAYLATAMERPLADAETEIAAAARLASLSPAILTDRAYIYHYYGRNEDALRFAQSALNMNPKFALGYFWQGRILTSLGHHAEADRAFQSIGALRSWTPAMAALGYMYGRAGRADDARKILAEFDALSRQGRYASAYAIGVIHAGLGDRERAIASLETAYRERSHWLLWLKRDPRWDDLRTNPRFLTLVRKVGLPE
jgi:tetratricopeptide (TPR) repeat protein